MTRHPNAVAIASLGVAAVATVHYLHVRRTERAKRVQIRSKLEQDLRAIQIAGSRVEEKILRGDYDNSIANIFVDMDFEIIAAHYE